jgi:DNA-binding beta-propeller fold protein YncE
VLAPTPLASGPGRLTSLGNDSFSLRATSAGSFLVRVHYTRFWTLAKGDGCVAEAPSGWTSVTARAAGTVVVVAHFSLERALGLGSSCKGSPST